MDISKYNYSRGKLNLREQFRKYQPSHLQICWVLEAGGPYGINLQRTEGVAIEDRERQTGRIHLGIINLRVINESRLILICLYLLPQ